LKAMGVQVGARDLPAPKANKSFPIEEVAAGRFIETRTGSTYVIEQDFPLDYVQGQVSLRINTRPMTIAEWAGEKAIADQEPEKLVFLDTETSGLAGGTGTFAFLVGVGRFNSEGFRLTQFFMRDPLEEPALLMALEDYLAACQTIVSFNGKTFDLPLLVTRYTLQGWKSPFDGLAHVDLLHLSRRLWRDRLPSRTLANLEVQVLHARRKDEEIPGWMIPQMYFDYLRDGDARPMLRVFYHNAMDVVSLAALLNHTSALLEEPGVQQDKETIELAAVARLMEDLGHTDKAAELYKNSLAGDLPEELYIDTILRLALLHKRSGDYETAIPLWVQAAAKGNVDACEELAKFYEHRAGDLKNAIKWTQKALELIDKPEFPVFIKLQFQQEFEHRLERLQRKISSENL
jgi:uncharacterized protein YprB with RNaseH-like and TPR domain